ncbi:MAG: [FeFe] hydrogenase H-cluster radical SAM maturase HydE [Elusimicrobia bacterium CG08_land_8_20_14_0_20_44_26]|nr:MAG: [FeFe] hydrogenase H-cluster radical SAM maturase HydE [Elusimicrobia bacterium CG08_land_8_20_14_0_20_44_26]
MCYAIPGKITDFDGKKVIVDYFGEKRYAYNEFKEVKKGDYIYAQGGFVINVVPEKEAMEILEFWKESFFKLREVDLRLARLEGSGVAGEKTRIILDKALEGRKIDFEEYLYLLSLEDENDMGYLFKVANFIRQKHHKNACCVHGIIEFSNFCSSDCLYCGIRKSNRTLERYRMSEEEILQTVREAVSVYGFKSIVLQSGEDPHFDADGISFLIRRILKENNLLLFISVGEVGERGLKKFYEAGARGVLIRFETSDKELYSKLHPRDALSYRMAEIRAAGEIGFLVLTGGLVGVPGQKNEDILKDIFAAKKLCPEMYTFGPFLPHPDTPLSQNQPPAVELVLKTIAVLRLADVNGKIVSTTALETLDAEKGRNDGFMAGANSLMLNLTPEKYRGLYNIYPGRIHEKETVKHQIDKAIEDLQKLGRAPTDIGLR